MSRALVLAALAVAATALWPTAASALGSRGCRDAPAFRCATLRVPLDRSGAVPGTIGLQVAFQGGSKPVLVALTGGPGQAGVPFAASFARSLAPALSRYRLAVLDQRGTGGSGVLQCPELQALSALAPFEAQSVAACADDLGPRRAFYGTVDTVDDLEALRAALGASKLALMGVSYGTYVATQYARIHPDRVDRLILDSTVGPAGADPYMLDTYARLPRVLRSLCGDGACREATPDPVADLATVARRLDAGGPLGGDVVDARARVHHSKITDAGQLASIVTSGDLNAGLLALLPGAMRAAADGDTAPLVRLRRVADGASVDADELSFGLNAATTCDDAALPYALADPLDRRVAGIAAATAAIPPGDYAPFATRTVIEGSTPADCLRWPGAPLPRAPSTAPLPDVPALILGGTLDTRTPIENAREVAALLPRATVVEVPGNGHDELDTDWTGCSTRALSRFVRDRPVGDPCRGVSLRPTIAPRAPRALADVRPLAGIAGHRGQVAAAALATVDDALNMAVARASTTLDERPGGGGLRGGRYEYLPGLGFRLTGASYVPGVRVSGLARLQDDMSIRGTLRVDGPGTLDGAVTVARGGRVTARLGGRTMRGTTKARTARTRTAPARERSLTRAGPRAF